MEIVLQIVSPLLWCRNTPCQRTDKSPIKSPLAQRDGSPQYACRQTSTAEDVEIGLRKAGSS